MNIILYVAIPRPLRTVFNYLPIPTKLKPQIGIRVYVPFGAKTIIGIIVGIGERDISDDKLKLKTIIQYLDTQPLLPNHLLSLIKWLSNYYHHPIGECIQTALPKKLQSSEPAKLLTETIWQLIGEPDIQSLGKKQAQIIQLLQCDSLSLSQREIYKQIGPCQSSLISLQKKQIINKQTKIKKPLIQASLPSSTPFQLNDEQQQAVNHIWRNRNTFSPYLLQGVTGSGKTEVYIQLTQRMLAEYKQVLVLVPEINLTIQLVDRFRRRLSARIVTLNSAISDNERKQSWLLIKEGLVDVAVGTRLAVFAPLTKLGLIIIDEEHDKAYKQQDGLKYHARSVALINAKQLAIPVVLGSATPSLESLYYTKQQRYQLLMLTKRATGATLPNVKLIDNSNLPPDKIISSELYSAIQTEITNNNQVLLFINRRGFSPVLFCCSCHWQAVCQQCDARMVVYKKRNILICHYCGLISALIKRCPGCHSTDLRTYGVGTEQVEQILQRCFPNTPVLRIDRDSTHKKHTFVNIVNTIQKGGSKILVGTQILAKGHDFQDVTLVGVLDSDQGLFSADFRATEVLAQLIIQVIGRAGRAKKRGQVLIQTQQPRHEFWRDLLSRGYTYIAEKLLQQRQATALPPTGSLCVIRAENKQQQLAMQFLTDVAMILNQHKTQVAVVGPVPAIMEKKAGRHRAQLLLSSLDKKRIHQLLDISIDKLSALKLAKTIRWSIDIDPVDLF